MDSMHALDNHENQSRFARQLPSTDGAARIAALKERNMLSVRILGALVLAGAMLAPTLSFGGDSGPPQFTCVLRRHHVVSVAPYQVEETRIKSKVTRLAGADVYVEAEPGLTPEWLRLEITRHLSQMHGASSMPSMKDCSLAAGVHVEVRSAGAGFTVRLIADDPKNAEEVLRRARQLLV
jgi:hypothetical protein